MLGETQQKTRHKIVDRSGNRYKELRKKHQMSQVDLAERIGMSQIGYSKYETGRCGMPTTILIKLARIYNVSIDYLLGLTDVEERYEYKYGTKN
ncbi:MAG: helix-turn-helix transcriptional regulator [Clostridia bacterium]|nr:helix-turn-helix transcriptional regulator [Clostridia bacterium]